MNLEDYVTELRDLASNLEDDVSTLSEMADGLEELKDAIEGATDFYEIKDALEEFECFSGGPFDLIQADYDSTMKNFDLEGWKADYENRVVLGEVPPETPTSKIEADVIKAKKKGKK